MAKILFLNNWLTDSENLSYPHQWIGERFVQHIHLLKERAFQSGILCFGIDQLSIEDADMYIWQERYRKPSELMKKTLNTGKPNILIATEPPIICPDNYSVETEKDFDRIFTWRTDRIDYQKYFPIRPMYFDPPGSVNKHMYDDRKLCVMMASLKVWHKESDALYSERKTTANWFAKHHPESFDYFCKDERYGEGNRCYKGPAADKLDTLAQYRFSICYENMTNCPGYISEKIFDSMYAGCVPVYWGESEVEKIIPANAFIDRRRFLTHEELYSFLISMGKEEWDQYVHNMKDFLDQSEFVRSYRPESFVNAMMKYAFTTEEIHK